MKAIRFLHWLNDTMLACITQLYEWIATALLEGPGFVYRTILRWLGLLVLGMLIMFVTLVILAIIHAL